MVIITKVNDDSYCVNDDIDSLYDQICSEEWLNFTTLDGNEVYLRCDQIAELYACADPHGPITGYELNDDE